jgi:hypothetical protein
MPTQEQLDELENAIIEDAITGVKSVTVDGMTVVGLTPQERRALMDEVTPDEVPTQTSFGMRHRRLSSPGGWGG